MMEWISVFDELPEVHEEVDTWDGGIRRVACTIHPDIYYDGVDGPVFLENGHQPVFGVTHFMRVEPPNGA